VKRRPEGAIVVTVATTKVVTGGIVAMPDVLTEDHPMIPIMGEIMDASTLIVT